MKHRLAYTDPLRTGRHPFQVYMLFLGMVSGLPLILWRPAGAESMKESMPDWVVLVWGLFLFGGSTLGLAGVFWRGSRLNALTLERVGLVFLSPAAFIYALATIAYRGGGSFVSFCIILGFGIACLARARDIRAIFRHALRETDRSV